MTRAVESEGTARHDEFDAIVVGSGPGGATVARELSLKGKRVLLLERGGNRPPRDGLMYMASVSDFVSVAQGVSTARAITTGGTSALYFGVAEDPPLDVFQSLGVDFSDALREARRELPLQEPVPDSLLGAQTLRIRDSATGLGLPWVKMQSMLIDKNKVTDGYSHAAVWRATSYVDEAVAHGATLINHARVRTVLTVDSHAVGVEYELTKGRRRELHKAFGRRVVLAAGALATSQIMRDSGIASAGNRGFYCDPSFFVIGHVDGLKGRDLFPGCVRGWGEDGIRVGDGCLSRALYRGQMLGSRRFADLFRHRKHVAVAVMVRDVPGGDLLPDGRLDKDFTREERKKFEKGAALAERIVRNAGAKTVIRTGLSAAHVGGLLRFGEHIDANLQTEVERLHVCDGSLLPENVQVTPVLTLVCLGKYLAARLERLL